MLASALKSRGSHFLLATLTCLGVAGTVWAQGRGAVEPPPPPANASTDPLLRGFEFRSIGPATMMGRVDDIAGTEKDPLLLYAGFATGGLWKSTDGGNHWKSQFDNMANESVGAIAIAPSNPDIVYVGKGEANNRQSSSIGDGVWGTTDGGKTWNHLGLEDTQSIARIVVDPTDPNIVYVAAMGHLFGPNAERGLYKSMDGGKTWKKSKFIDNYHRLYGCRDRSGESEESLRGLLQPLAHVVGIQRRRSGFRPVEDHGRRRHLEAHRSPELAEVEGRHSMAALRFPIFKAKPTTIYAQVETGASGGTGSGTGADGGPARGRARTRRRSGGGQ